MLSLIKSLSFSTLDKIGGGFVFVIALLTYTLTLEPTTSFWDCGEYIATAHKIQVGHPPGAPLFVIIANFFSNLTFGNTTNVAWMINFMSALCSALTITFLFWIITLLSKKILSKEIPEKEMSLFSKFSIIFGGFIGSLIYTFSDSFWFSAVEGEVYAMSSLFTALVFWSILKWESEFEKAYANRWLILIAFLIGLSVGVHMLNLLAIPAITSIYLYKKWQTKNYTNFFKFTLINIIGIFILGLIFYIIVPQTVNLFGKTELYFVNKLGLSFNSGTIAFLITLVILIVSILIYSQQKKLVNLNTLTLSFLFFLIGYSSFFVLIIRSNANTPIDENNPEDAVSLLAYLNREQYGSHPLIYGHSFNSTESKTNNGNPVYVQGYELKNTKGNLRWKDINGKSVYKEDFSTKEKAQNKQKELLNKEKNKSLTFEINDKYIISDARKDWKREYNNESFFPRMWSSSSLHINGRMNDGYLYWSEKKKNDGKIPTFMQNIKFFWNYQIKHMYIRYFMWNFSGKQNDIQGHGNKLDGNWITGINPIDEYVLGLGPQTNLPKHLKENAGYNKYFLLPFLLGLIGIFFHATKQKKDFWAIFLLFFFTGLAIVIQLNQTPYQPRERDYAYVGSFFAYAIWTGIGALGILQFIKITILNNLDTKLQKIYLKRICVGVCIFLLSIPSLMAYQNWDDHDRSNRYTARDFAKNYLASCKPNAILFTMGDNDTFPLWYVQEVEGYRTDVRVVNLSLLNTDWYIDQMKKDAYDGKAVPFSLEKDLYKQGTRDVAYYYPYSQLIQDKQTIESLKNQPLNAQNLEIRSYLESLFFRISERNRNVALETLGDILNLPFEKTKDALFLDSTGLSETVFELSEFNNWIKNDQEFTKINITENKAEVYFPMSKLKFDVNKEKVLENNIILNSDLALIEDSLLIDFSKNKVGGLDKKSLMMLDLLEKNNWERPIYFAITIGDPNHNPEPFLFLNDYLQLDGMVYQLVPIKNVSPESGTINTDVLYDNIMNKFKWGGIDLSNDIYIDETNARMIRNFKNIFNRLASKLIEQGDINKAESVIKKSLNTINPELVPFEIYDLPLLENYFDLIIEKHINQIQISDIDSLNLEKIDSLNLEKINSLNLEYKNLNLLIERLINRYNSDLEYYNSFLKYNRYKRDFLIQSQIRLAAQSLSALYLLQAEIPIINENEIEKIQSRRIINENFNNTIKLIEHAYNENNANTTQNLFSILTTYTEIAHTNKEVIRKLMVDRKPKIAKQLNTSVSVVEDFLNSKFYDTQTLNYKFNELERISNLINPEPKKSSSDVSMCMCIEKDLNNTITNECISYLNNLFSDSEEKITEEVSNCPELFQLFWQKQMKAMEESGDL